MSENSKIEWTDHTFNPWEGCQKVGPGCDHCYAETRNARFGGGVAVNWGPGAPRRRTSAANWQLPARWNAQADAFMAQHGRRQRVFCSSLADVFDNAVDPAWRVDLFRLIRETPRLDWLLLTKRVGNVERLLAEALDLVIAINASDPLATWLMRWLNHEKAPNNVWLGVTIVNQEEADRDIQKLRAVNARVRFLSMEPLLEPVTVFSIDGPVDVPDGMPSPLHWVIVGGESGPGARPMHPDWARSLRDQCQAAGVAFLFKQWGEWLPGENEPHPTVTERDGSPRRVAHHQDGRWGSTATKINDSNYVTWDETGAMHAGKVGYRWRVMTWAERVGKKAAGRLLDGRTWDEVPE